MKVSIFPRQALEAKWLEYKKLYSPDAVKPPLCLRCGERLHRELSVNALSRHANVMICNKCGTDEALRDYSNSTLPQREWYAVKHGVIQPDCGIDVAMLDAVCSFQEVFDEPKRPVWFSSMGEPVSKLAYSRSYYRNQQWYTTWFECREKPKDEDSAKEIDDFQSALMALPEFEDLYTMSNLCLNFAEPTSEPTEFNLYSVTPHFYVWLRMITRQGDYNLYCHYFYKERPAEDSARPV